MTSAPIPVDDDVANAVEPRRFLFKAAVFVSLIAVAAATIVYTEYPTRLAFQLVLAAVLAHGTELVHECIHRLATGRERVDRCIGSILAQTTCISFALYHFLHLQHHRYVGTPHDRDSFSDALARLHSSSRHTRIRALLRHLTMADHWKATARRVAAAAVGRLAQELISEQPTLPAAVAQRVQRDYRVIGAIALLALLSATLGTPRCRPLADSTPSLEPDPRRHRAAGALRLRSNHEDRTEYAVHQGRSIRDMADELQLLPRWPPPSHGPPLPTSSGLRDLASRRARPPGPFVLGVLPPGRCGRVHEQVKKDDDPPTDPGVCRCRSKGPCYRPPRAYAPPLRKTQPACGPHRASYSGRQLGRDSRIHRRHVPAQHLPAEGSRLSVQDWPRRRCRPCARPTFLHRVPEGARPLRRLGLPRCIPRYAPPVQPVPSVGVEVHRRRRAQRRGPEDRSVVEAGPADFARGRPPSRRGRRSQRSWKAASATSRQKCCRARVRRRRLLDSANMVRSDSSWSDSGASCEKRVRPSFCLRPRGERGSADGTQRSQDDSDRHCGRGAGAAGVHGACLPVMRASTREEMRRISSHEPFQFTVVLDPLPVKAEFVFGELQADGFSAGLPRPVVVGAVAGVRVVMAAAGGATHRLYGGSGRCPGR